MPTENWFERPLANCENADVRLFFESARARKQARRAKSLVYNDANGQARWLVTPQIHNAYVVQKGRFSSDETFWRYLLYETAFVGPKRKLDHNADLRFHLVTAKDFRVFQTIAETEAEVCKLDWEISRRKR
jgi:hypothetical protein